MDEQAIPEETKEKGQPQETEKFKPGWKLLCAFVSVAIVNLACALDATIISVALPVCLLFMTGGLDSMLIS